MPYNPFPPSCSGLPLWALVQPGPSGFPLEQVGRGGDGGHWLVEYLQDRHTFHISSINLLAWGLCVLCRKSCFLFSQESHPPLLSRALVSPLLQEHRPRPRGHLEPQHLLFLSQNGFHNFHLTLRWDSKFHDSSDLMKLIFFVS